MLQGKEVDLYNRFTDLFNSKKQNGQIYDLRTNGKDTGTAGRWIDQKCHPDLLHIVFDSLINYVDDKSEELSIKIIDVEISWQALCSHKYSKDNINNLFQKPEASEKTKHEYDKFYGQPLELLTYAGLLKKSKHKGSNVYKIKSQDDYKIIYELNIARQRNVEIFLYTYVVFVLTESSLKADVDIFLNKQTNQDYLTVKDTIIKYYIDNTNSCTKSSDTKDIRRIYPRFINILAYIEKKKGVIDGRISKDKIHLQDISYNRTNERDKGKGKNVSRQEHLEIQLKTNPMLSLDYSETKAKTIVKKYNKRREKIHGTEVLKTPLGEFRDNNAYPLLALEAHHMIAKNQDKAYANFIANLILLTPNQHRTEAHPNSNFNITDPIFQKKYLISKYEIILDSLKDEYSIYKDRIPDYFEMINDFIYKKIKILDEDKLYSLQDFKYIIETI